MKINKTIALCASVACYRELVDVAGQLRALGYAVAMPAVAELMAASGDWRPETYKTWFADASQYDRKATYMRAHFAKVAAADACLVVNGVKHGVAGYIGANVLMEMALAFYVRKEIFILHALPAGAAYEEEVKGMGVVWLDGKISSIVFSASI